MQRRSVLGQDNRKLGNKSLKLLRFVTERIDPTSPVTEGEMLVEEWNRENPQWAYGKDDTRTFWRDYNRVRKAIMMPEYEWYKQSRS